MDFCTRYFFLFVLLTLSPLGNAQIESGKVGNQQPKVRTAKPAKEKRPIDFSSVESQIFLGGFLGSSDRVLRENASVFGDPIGQRETEGPLLTGGFETGVRTKLSERFRLSFGVSYATYGEQNSVAISDSSFNYVNRYSYVGLPIAIQYIRGNRLRFVSGIGLQPNLFVRGRQENEAISPAGVSTEGSITYREEMNFFTLQGIAQLGLEYQFGARAACHLIPEYRFQFTNSFTNQAAYVHQVRWFGARFGLVFTI